MVGGVDLEQDHDNEAGSGSLILNWVDLGLDLCDPWLHYTGWEAYEPHIVQICEALVSRKCDY
ncbi:hypothetical protein EJB05_40640, partial [Eragrostis curvula]